MTIAAETERSKTRVARKVYRYRAAELLEVRLDPFPCPPGVGVGVGVDEDWRSTVSGVESVESAVV